MSPEYFGFFIPLSQHSEKQISVLAKITDLDKEETGLLPHRGISVKRRNSLGHLRASPCPKEAVNKQL